MNKTEKLDKVFSLVFELRDEIGEIKYFQHLITIARDQNEWSYLDGTTSQEDKTSKIELILDYYLEKVSKTKLDAIEDSLTDCIELLSQMRINRQV